MTLQRIPFRAHDRDPVLGAPCLQARETVLVRRGLGKAVVLDLAVDVALSIVRASTQFPPEEDVVDACPRERGLKGVAVELRIEATSRSRPDISDSGDAVLTDQAEKAI